MNTDVKVEEVKKEERRKTFKAMNSLPWIVLVVVLILLLISNRKHALNDVAPPIATPKEVVESIDVANSNKLHTIEITNIVNKVIVQTVIVTNFVQSINNDEFVKRWNVLESNLYKKAQQDFKVEAVSNGYARWSCTIEGVPIFEWKNELLSITNIVKGPKIEQREIPFTYHNMSLIKGLDIEKELRNSIYQIIEMNFVELMEASNANVVKEKLQGDIDRVIKELFDGFETYNKSSKRW